MFFRKQKIEISNLISKSFWGALAFLLCFGFLVQADDNSETDLIENEKEELIEKFKNFHINEIFPNPSGENYNTENCLINEENLCEEEWIELYNSYEEELELKGYTLVDKNLFESDRYNCEKIRKKYESDKNTDLKGCSLKGVELFSEYTCEEIKKKFVFGENDILAKDEFKILKKSDFKFTLNNKNEDVYLLSDKCLEIKKVSYEDEGDKNLSYSFDGNDWKWTKFLTPGKENNNKENNNEDKDDEEGSENKDKCSIENRPELSNVRLNEILADPLEGEEWIELYNSGNKDINLKGCLLADKSYYSKDKYFEFEDLIIKPKNFLVVEKSDFRFTLNNSNEEIYFLDSKVEYGSGKKGFSYSFDGEKWEWTEILTPGDDNQFPREKCSLKNQPELKQIILNEIFPNPFENEDQNEWIELKNTSNKKINLEGCRLADGNYTPEDFNLNKTFEIESKIEIDNKKFSLFSRNEFGFGMNNSGDLVYFLDSQGNVLDQIDYKSSEEGFSYALNDKNEWQWIEDSTPGTKNVFPEPKTYSRKVEITELMPNPEGSDKDKEWLELFNQDKEDIELEGWYLLNQSNKKFNLNDFKIGANKFLKVEIKNSSFSIKNSAGWIELRNPNDEIVDRVEYLESAKVNASYNKKSKSNWEWSIFITPGKENKFNHPPTYRVKIPDEIYKDFKTEFKIIDAKDKDREDLKYRWEFSTGKRSYIPITTQTFDKKGAYTVEVRVSDASIDIFKSFKFRVESFPEFDLKIVKLLPNPAGLDSENEKIWIKNNEKKRINLKGWIIATGKDSESLVNHYIKDDFKIEAGDTKSVERDDCAFSLLNKKARIVLKSPNGKIVDKVKYEKEKIKDDEIYLKQDEEWVWVTPEVSSEKNKTQVLGLSQNPGENKNLEQTDFFEIFKEILNENQKGSSSLRVICFNNWLYSQSQKPLFKIVFPEFLTERIES